MTSKDLEKARATIAIQQKALAHDAWRSCLNCDFWKEKENHCAKWKATPPAETIVLSCEQWMYKIPF